MKVAVILSLSILALGACVTAKNRCLHGYDYAPQYDACVASATAASSADAATDAATPDAAPSGDAGGADNVGAACSSNADCGGPATYCLKDPTASPAEPGICTIQGCPQTACSGAYTCCDCSAGIFDELKAWPVGTCAPASNKSDLTMVGCTCS